MTQKDESINCPAGDALSVCAVIAGKDLCDLFLKDDDHLVLAMADIDDDKTPADLFKQNIRSMIHEDLGPEEILERLDGLSDENIRVRTWLGIVDLQNGKMTYSGSGIHPLVISRKKEIGHLKAGNLKDGGYRKAECILDLEDVLVLHTAEQAYSKEETVMDCLKEHADGSIADMVHGLRDTMVRLMKDGGQEDDLTVMAFDYSRKDMKNETVEKTFEAKDEHLHDVISFVEEILERHEVGMKDTMAITVAVEEMFVNIAHYAYEGDTGEATVSVEIGDEYVKITLIDSGIPFDPIGKDDPDIKAGADEREIGGLGIYMVKKSMDECSYARENDRNIFTMKRMLNRQSI